MILRIEKNPDGTADLVCNACGKVYPNTPTRETGDANLEGFKAAMADHTQTCPIPPMGDDDECETPCPHCLVVYGRKAPRQS